MESKDEKREISIEDVRKYFIDCNADPEKMDLEGFCNLFNVIWEMTNHKLSKDDILDGYALLRNLITGNDPDKVMEVPDENSIRVMTRYMEAMGQTKEKLELIEKYKMAFCVYYSAFFGLDEFSDRDLIDERFCRDRQKNEERYRFPESYLIPEDMNNGEVKKDLILVANAMIDGDTERLMPRLMEECVYVSETGGVNLKGKGEIEEHFKRVAKAGPGIHFCYLAKAGVSDETDEHPRIRRCIAIAMIEEHNYRSLAFVEHNDEGYINRIKLVRSSKYRFRIQDHMIPERRDDYGLVADNPVEVRGIDTEYFYLDNLMFEDGSPVIYERAGSVVGNRVRPIDRFRIWRSEEEKGEGIEPESEIYLYGYGKKSSITEPRGFMFASDRYVRAVCRPDLFIPDMI